MEKHVVLRRGMFYIAVSLLFIYCITFFLFFKSKYKKIETFASGPVWTVTLPDGSEHEHVDLSHTRLQYNLKEGEVLTLETDLDASFGGIAVFPDEAAGFDTVGGLIDFKAAIYKKSRSDVP